MSQKVHHLEPWPQELERPDTSPDASNGIRHGPCHRHGRGVGSESYERPPHSCRRWAVLSTPDPIKGFKMHKRAS